MLAAGWLDWVWSKHDTPEAHFVYGLLALACCILIAWSFRGWARSTLRKHGLDPQVSILAVRLITIGIVILGFLIFITQWLGNPALIFGGFGFFALALSLAFQDILKNFIAGIFLLVERPFRIGDEIVVDAHTGMVENIELRTTTLRTAEGEEVLVPNASVYTGTIVNRTRFPTRQFALTAKVPAGVALDGLTQRVRESLSQNPAVATEPPSHVGLQPSIDGGVTLEVRYWLDYRRYDPLQVQADLGRQIYQAIQSGSANSGQAASPGSPASGPTSAPGRRERGGKGGQIS
jgi:small-conductance mechanosensitive channel